jgi:light-regulated signal transduction histidine kinase (bacteriophytochrome)
MPSISSASVLRDASMVAIHVERDGTRFARWPRQYSAHTRRRGKHGMRIPCLARITRARSMLGVSHPRASLGLINSVLQLIVEMHGGCIWVESATRQGSTFRIMSPEQATLRNPVERTSR